MERKFNRYLETVLHCISMLFSCGAVFTAVKVLIEKCFREMSQVWKIMTSMLQIVVLPLTPMHTERLYEKDEFSFSHLFLLDCAALYAPCPPSSPFHTTLNLYTCTKVAHMKRGSRIIQILVLFYFTAR